MLVAMTVSPLPGLFWFKFWVHIISLESIDVESIDV